MESGRRIRVDLSEFYNDHRKLAYVRLNDSCKRVYDFQVHIQSVLKIGVPIYLTTSDGIYLPSGETIDLLEGMNQVVLKRSGETQCFLPVPNSLQPKEDNNEQNEDIDETAEFHRRRTRVRKRKRKTLKADDGFEAYKQVLEKIDKNEPKSPPRKKKHVRFLDEEKKYANLPEKARILYATEISIKKEATAVQEIPKHCNSINVDIPVKLETDPVGESIEMTSPAVEALLERLNVYAKNGEHTPTVEQPDGKVFGEQKIEATMFQKVFQTLNDPQKQYP